MKQSYSDIVSGSNSKTVPLSYVVAGESIQVQVNQTISHQEDKIRDTVKQTFGYLELNDSDIDIRFYDSARKPIVNNNGGNADSICFINAKVKVVFDDLKQKLDDLTEKVKMLEIEGQNRHKRSLIEQGRLSYWNTYGAAYEAKYKGVIDGTGKAFIRHVRQYNSEQGKWFTDYLPTNWNHFFETIPAGPDKLKSFLNLLKGGKDSTYCDLSNAIHTPDVESAAALVTQLNEKEYSDLFEFVFGKSAAEVLQEYK